MTSRPTGEHPLLRDFLQVVTAELAAHGVDPQSIELVAANHGCIGIYGILSGLMRFLDADADQDGVVARSPTLLFGLSTEDTLREVIRRHPDSDSMQALIEWPGLVYLQYGFDTQALIDGARRAQVGACTPLERTFQADTVSGRRLCRVVRHWIKGRISVLQGAGELFVEAAGNGTPLHRTLLEPISALTPEHRAMLSRLIRLEAALEGTPSGEGAGKIDLPAALARFEADWQSLEESRAAARLASMRDPAGADSAHAEANRAMAGGYTRVCEDLERLQSAIDAFDIRLQQRLPATR